MPPKSLFVLSPTDLTFEEINSSNMVFIGDYLNTIDASFEDFKKDFFKSKKKTPLKRRKKIFSNKQKS